MALGLTVIVVAALGCRAPAPGAQDRLSVDTQMTKGPAAAPVTIVEFSDYQ
jgi:protein-disulfide isomerase